jgi:hypothetical protein
MKSGYGPQPAQTKHGPQLVSNNQPMEALV